MIVHWEALGSCEHWSFFLSWFVFVFFVGHGSLEEGEDRREGYEMNEVDLFPVLSRWMDWDIFMVKIVKGVWVGEVRGVLWRDGDDRLYDSRSSKSSFASFRWLKSLNSSLIGVGKWLKWGSLMKLSKVILGSVGYSLGRILVFTLVWKNCAAAFGYW